MTSWLERTIAEMHERAETLPEKWQREYREQRAALSKMTDEELADELRSAGCDEALISVVTDRMAGFRR